MPAPINRDDLIQAIRELANELGRTPTAQEFHQNGEYSYTPIRRTFDGWPAAVEAAGLEPHKRQYTDEQLLEIVRETAEELGHTPSLNDFSDVAEPDSSTITKRFKSWNAAMAAAGLEPNTDNASVDPVTVECDACGTTLQRQPARAARHEFHFCNLDCRGDYWSENRAGEDHPSWEDDAGVNRYYGKTWNKQRKKARERDDYTCQACGVTQSEYREEHGLALDVHHVRPSDQFECTDNANQLSNLVTLCRPCHKQWEGIPIRPEGVI